MPEHIHLFVHAKPVHAPDYILGQIKGYTARIIGKEVASAKRRLPILWARSYYVESIGRISRAHRLLSSLLGHKFTPLGVLLQMP